jgi:hypothetical protein
MWCYADPYNFSKTNLSEKPIPILIIALPEHYIEAYTYKISITL